MAPRRKVLIIDDDKVILDLVSRVLSKNGYQAVVSPSVEDGLEQFGHVTYDLVMIDLFMEGVGGIEGIRLIREQREDVKIIAISAGYDDMDSADALAAAKKIGADAVLPKPLEFNELPGLIEEILEDSAEGPG